MNKKMENLILNTFNMGYDFKEEDVRQYLQMLQDTIKRMASNSSSCKNWMITLVTALLALMIGVEELLHYIWLVIIPVIMFWFLDFYYLLLENRFRNHENEFICQLKDANRDGWKDTIFTFNIKIPDNNYSWKLRIKCFRSPSIIYFYPIIVVLIIVITLFTASNIT